MTKELINHINEKYVHTGRRTDENNPVRGLILPYEYIYICDKGSRQGNSNRVGQAGSSSNLYGEEEKRRKKRWSAHSDHLVIFSDCPGCKSPPDALLTPWPAPRSVPCPPSGQSLVNGAWVMSILSRRLTNGQ